MKFLFINMSALKFTVETPAHAPLGGSESALCYLARALAARHHQVALAANLPEHQGGDILGVRHFSLSQIKDRAFFAAEEFDIIVLCNVPAAAPALKALSPNARIVFWAHALPDQPAMQALAQKECRDAIDDIIFVSAWQRSKIGRVFGPFKADHIIGNGISPAFEDMFGSADELKSAKQSRAAYTATPFRGLSVLLRAMQGMNEHLTLDLFSSMKVYQSPDDEYAKLFRLAQQNPAIICHGSLPQDALAHHLRECAFLFYPSIYPETFCISVAEAMAAGMKIVTTRLGALEETTMGLADLVPIASSDGEQLSRDFHRAMQRAVDDFAADRDAWAETMFIQSRRANALYRWESRAEEWEEYLSLGR